MAVGRREKERDQRHLERCAHDSSVMVVLMRACAAKYRTPNQWKEKTIVREKQFY